jgi:signal peptidase II
MLTFAAASLVFTLDAASKRIVRVLPHRTYHVMRGLRVTRVELVRTRFSSARDRASLLLWWSIALTCAVVLILSGEAFQTAAAQLGVGAALGGAFGNLFDVLRRRAITDFLDVGWWPVFNIADVGILGGLVLAFWPMV